MKDLIKHIVQPMVDKPEEVEISEIEGDQITVLKLRVAKADIGKVIGKKGRNEKGRNVRAIRTILSAASAKEKKHTVLEILE
jgi:predicted RNA-binding protein YlqC (UPF0109 family)